MRRRVWEFLPARRTRGRVTTPTVIAANLGVSVAEVVSALLSMERDGHAVQDKHGSWHRGLPLH